MSNDILLQILKLWDLVEKYGVFNIRGRYFVNVYAGVFQTPPFFATIFLPIPALYANFPEFYAKFSRYYLPDVATRVRYANERGGGWGVAWVACRNSWFCSQS